MALFMRMFAKVLQCWLFLAMALFIFCGCAPEPILVKVIYQGPQANDPAGGFLPETAIRRDESGTMAQGPPDGETDTQSGPADGVKGAPPSASPALAILLPPFPSPTPTLLLTPTPSPTPVPSPSPTPTSTPQPTPSPTSNAQNAIKEATDQYEKAVAAIQSKKDEKINAWGSMLASLEASKIAHPESAAKIQIEIDALRASIDAAEAEAAAQIEAERARYQAVLASYGG